MLYPDECVHEGRRLQARKDDIEAVGVSYRPTSLRPSNASCINFQLSRMIGRRLSNLFKDDSYSSLRNRNTGVFTSFHACSSASILDVGSFMMGLERV